MNLLGLDTSTAATAVCVLRGDGAAFEVVPEPSALAGRPAHTRELMPSIDRTLAESGLDWPDLDAIAVGTGPGAYTGLRIGIATARALAQAASLRIRAVSSLAALAEGARSPLVLPLIDARRGELFAALYSARSERWPAFVETPDRLAERLRADMPSPPQPPVAVGSGAIRFRGPLEAAGAEVPGDESHVHVVRALHVCRLAADIPAVPPEAVLPDYLRLPDAKPAT